MKSCICFLIIFLLSWAKELSLPVRIISMSPTGRYGIFGYTTMDPVFKYSKTIEPYINSFIIYDFETERTWPLLPNDKYTLASLENVEWFNMDSVIILTVNEFQDIELRVIYSYFINGNRWEKIILPCIDTLIDSTKAAKEYHDLIKVFGQVKADSVISSIEGKQSVSAFKLLPYEKQLIFSYMNLFPYITCLVRYDLEKQTAIDIVETPKLLLPIGYLYKQKKLIVQSDINTFQLLDTTLSVCNNINLVDFIVPNSLTAFIFKCDVLYFAGRSSRDSIALFTYDINTGDINRIIPLRMNEINRISVSANGEIIVEYRDQLFEIMGKSNFTINGKHAFWRNANDIIYVTRDNKEIKQINLKEKGYLEKTIIRFQGCITVEEN